MNTKTNALSDDQEASPVAGDETTQTENNLPEGVEPEDSGTQDNVPDDMWASLANDDDEDDSSDADAEEDSEETPAGEEPATDEQPAEVQPPAQEEQKPTAEVKPEETRQPPQQPQQQPQMSNEEMQKYVSAQREQLLGELAKQFPVNEEDADLLVTSPEKVMPKLAANLFLRTYEAVMQGVQQKMPQMVLMANEVQETKTALESQFYEKWEMLDKSKHKDLVDRYGIAYLQTNPNATREDFIRDVGASAVVALGLPFPQVQQPTQQAAPPPVRPSAPVGRPPAPKGPMNQFEQLAADFEDEDL